MQVNSGPPVIASTPQGVRSNPVGIATPAARDDMPQTTEQAERVEMVRELVVDLKRLAGFVTDADDRLTRIQAEIHEDTPPGARAVWDAAATELGQTLNGPIQLAPGDVPIALEEAAKTFRHWVDVFTENAVGPGGEGLHDDEDRLQVFQEKLEAVDPPVTVLVHRTRDLLARHDLDVDVLTRKAAQAATITAKDEDRLSKLDPLITELKGSWTAQLTAATEQTKTLAKQLTQYVTASEQSERGSPDGIATPLTKAARDDTQGGLRQLTALPLNHARQTLATIIDWAEKWHDEPSFTATTLATRIQSELAGPLRDVREQLAHLTNEFSPQAFAAREAERQAEHTQARHAAANQRITTLRERYQVLVNLRRQKLGTDPDERYFGEVAKRVNDAITRLASLETELVSNSQFSISNSQSNSNDSMTKRVETLLRETEHFVDPAKLETILGAQDRLRTEAAGLAAAAEAAQTAKQAVQDEVARRERALQESQEEGHAETKRQAAATEAARRGYTSRVTRLRIALTHTQERFRSALAYTTALERLLPTKAEEQYAALNQIASTMTQPVAFDQLVDLNRPAAEIEHDLTQLETVFGNHGAVESTLNALTSYQQTHPLAELQRRNELVEIIRDELRVRRHELAERRRELADATAERRALTPDEARRWLDLLDEQREILATSTRELEEIETRVADLARHLDDQQTATAIDGLRQQLEGLTVPVIARSTAAKQSRDRHAFDTAQARDDAPSPIGQRLRAQLSQHVTASEQSERGSPNGIATPLDEAARDDKKEEDVPVASDDAEPEVDIPIKHE